MINALFIFNQKGDVVISRLFKDGVKRNISDIFRIQVISNLDVCINTKLNEVSILYILTHLPAQITLADIGFNHFPTHQT